MSETQQEIQRPEPKAITPIYWAWEEAADGATVGFYSSPELALEGCQRHLQEVHEITDEQLILEESTTHAWRNGEYVKGIPCWRTGGYQIDTLAEVDVDIYLP